MRYRALRADAAFPLVEINGSYETIYEDGDPHGHGGVLLIEPFEVPVDGDEEFVAAWHAARDILARAQGYLGARLLRGTDTDFSFVGVVRWSSPLMYARAHKPAMPFASHPALYQPATPS